MDLADDPQKNNDLIRDLQTRISKLEEENLALKTDNHKLANSETIEEFKLVLLNDLLQQQEILQRTVENYQKLVTEIIDRAQGTESEDHPTIQSLEEQLNRYVAKSAADEEQIGICVNEIASLKRKLVVVENDHEEMQNQQQTPMTDLSEDYEECEES